MTPVFELIKSLTPNEKGYFKRFCELQKGEKNYLDLFNVLDKMERYDEKVLKAAFEERTFFKSLHVTKNYLYHLIMRSLRTGDRHSPIDQQINDHLTDAALLEKRGLYKQAIAALAKAKKSAAEYHRFPLLLTIIKREATLWHLLEDRHLIEKIQAINRELIETATEIRHEVEIYTYYQRWITLQRSGQQQADPEAWKTLLQEWTAFEEAHLQSLYKSFYSIYLADCIRATVAFFEKNPEKRFFHSERVLEKWESHPHMIREEPQIYKIHLANHLSCCFQLRKWELFPAIIDKLKATPAGSFNEEAEVFQNYAFYQLLYFLNTLDFERAKAALPDITRDLVVYGARVNKARELAFHYNISILYFMLDDFDKALLWLVKIINQPATDHRRDLQRFAHILQLFYHYELGSIDFLHGIHQNVKRRLHRWEPLNSWEIFLFQLIDQLLNAWSEKEVRRIFKASLEQLTTMDAGKMLGYDEIKIWLEKKGKTG